MKEKNNVIGFILFVLIPLIIITALYVVFEIKEKIFGK